MPTKYASDEVYKSRWLKADDLPEDKDLVLTIQDVNDEQVGEDKELKLILSFKEVDKELVLNVTNARVLEDKYGKDPNAWINKRIALFAMEVSFGKKTTLGIRIRIKTPAAPAKVQVTAIPEPDPIPDELLEEPEGVDELAADY